MVKVKTGAVPEEEKEDAIERSWLVYLVGIFEATKFGIPFHPEKSIPSPFDVYSLGVLSPVPSSEPLTSPVFDIVEVPVTFPEES